MWLMTLGLATAMPPTALVTETAGVRMPSAMTRDVPNRAYRSMSSASKEGYWIC